MSKHPMKSVSIASAMLGAGWLFPAGLAAQTNDLEYQCVIVGAPSSANLLAAIPLGMTEANSGDTFYVEFWATDSGNENTGLVSAYLDVDYPETQVLCGTVWSTSLFSLFDDGVCDGFVIDELGGSQLNSNVGAEPQWARVAFVEYTAIDGGLATFALMPAASESSAYNRGLIMPSYIGYGSCALLIDGCGNLDHDIDVDGEDFAQFLAAFGHSAGDAGYSADADMDGDGTVTFVDYQQWIQCYRDFVGNPVASAPPPGMPGDLDADQDVDLIDFAAFQDCTANAPAMALPCILKFDFDGSGTIDVGDVPGLVEVFFGP